MAKLTVVTKVGGRVLGGVDVTVAYEDGHEEVQQTDGRSGKATFAVDEAVDPQRLGIVTVKPVAKVDNKGSVLRYRRPAECVPLAAGQEKDLVLTYQPTARIVLKAMAAERTGAAPVKPLRGARFTLRDGAGRPVREVGLDGTPVVVLDDLQPGAYTLALSPPDGTPARLRLRRGRPVWPLTLAAGDDVRLDYEYEPDGVGVRGEVRTEDGSPVEDVSVRLADVYHPGREWAEDTDAQGRFAFLGVPVGTYTLTLGPQEPTADRRWSLDGPVTVVDIGDTGKPVPPQPLTVVPERHVIRGVVKDADGQAAPGVLIEVRDTPGGQPVHLVSGADGGYEYVAPRAGTYYVAVALEGGQSVRTTPVVVNSEARQDLVLPSADGRAAQRGASPPPGGGNLDDTAFPLLTKEVDGTGGGGGAAPGTGSAREIVERGLRRVLGWKARPGDARGFTAALNQSFAGETRYGHTEYRWTPRSYAVDVKGDLGAVTGAQGSLYSQARAVQDQALPLLDGLKPLKVDFDVERTDAVRGVARSQIVELVGELGIEGGPRVTRVDLLFLVLLGDDLNAAPDEIEGSLGAVRDEFGLEIDGINTVDEERNFTNFLLLVDWLSGLRRAWEINKKFFDATSDAPAFLGTELVLLSRTLAVAAESVEEVAAALDSVFIGPAERQTIRLTLRDGTLLTVDELLSWVTTFTTEEGPRLIEEGGRIGVGAFLPIVEALRDAVADARDPGQPEVTQGFRTARVRRALEELSDHLETAVRQARRIAPAETAASGRRRILPAAALNGRRSGR